MTRQQQPTAGDRVVAPYTRGPASPLDDIGALSAPALRAVATRLDLLVSTLAGTAAPTLADTIDAVAEHVGRAPDTLWLAHAVLAAELPSDEDISDLLVRARLGGTWAALTPVIEHMAGATRFRSVTVLRGATTCDVHTTAESELLSGIQRVVRETTSRWERDHHVSFVGWTRDLTGLRPIRDEEHLRMFARPGPVRTKAGLAPVIVPWEGTHLWVEVIVDLRRTGRLLALAQHSRNEVGVLGYDAIPVTSAATVAQGMTSLFARSLAAARRTDRVAMISAAAAEEFAGVMAMGAGRRDPGPEVAAVPLAVRAPVTTQDALAEARATLLIEGLPLILVVGSHEPRKNHLAVLHAAELLWREGLWFNLALIGAGSWNAHEYEQTVNGLVANGRPVQSIRALPDELLGAAYRLAHCTLFPSLNEGFGLPVAESLAVGTPVITSGFGSMRDIVAPDGVPLGGLLVDPRDDTSLADALRTMLTDDATYARLRAETAQHAERTWDDYADELWSYLVDGVQPGSSPSSTDHPRRSTP